MRLRRLINSVTDRHFVLYTIIGLSGVVIDFLLFIALTSVFQINPIVANFISISAGIVNNFLLNRAYNFKKYDDVFIRFLIFYLTGFAGLILSELLLLGLHYGIGIHEILAKILTLLPVLLFQFAINKKLSFGSTTHFKSLAKKVVHHWPAIAVIFFITLCMATVAKQIPDNFSITTPKLAPDESTHYIFNVEFIAKHGALPVSGKDDVEAYKACRDNPSGLVPCVYSYTFYPGPNYVISAISSSVVPKILPIGPQKASRLPSLLYGVVFLACIYVASHLITRQRYVSTLLLSGTGLIPQFIFTSSYTNLDAHSLAISGIVALSLTYALLRPQNRFSIPVLGIAIGGLLPVAKYNYFIFFIPIALLLLYLLVRHVITTRQLVRLVLWSVVSFVLLASFWYIRSWILYSDPLGQTFAVNEMAKYHELGQKNPIDIYAVAKLAQDGFFQILFRSYYVNFGSMNYPLDESRYAIPAFGIVASAFIILRTSRDIVARHKKKMVLYASALFSLTFVLTLGLVVYNSLIYDFQPQGRYLFPLLSATALYIAYLVRLNRSNELIALAYASTTVFIFINAVELFMRVYINV